MIIGYLVTIYNLGQRFYKFTIPFALQNSDGCFDNLCQLVKKPELVLYFKGKVIYVDCPIRGGVSIIAHSKGHFTKLYRLKKSRCFLESITSVLSPSWPILNRILWEVGTKWQNCSNSLRSKFRFFTLIISCVLSFTMEISMCEFLS